MKPKNKFICTETCFKNGRLWKKENNREEELESYEKEIKHFKRIDSVGAPVDDFSNDQRAVYEFLLSMDQDDDSLWTKSGLPAVGIVERGTGLDLDREIIETVIPGFTRKSIKVKAGGPVYEPNENGNDQVSSEDPVALKKVKNFLLTMNPEEDSQWTSAGLPQVKFVSDGVKMDVTRSVITAALPGFSRNSGIKLPSTPSTGTPSLMG